MGNNPSSNAKSPTSASSSPSNHESTKTPSSSHRRDPRNLIQNQRSAAAAEASLAQARGTTTASHRPRNSQSIPSAHFNPASASPNNNSPSPRSNPLPTEPQQSKEEQRSHLRDQPSQPVNVPASAINAESASLRSHSQSIDPSGPPAIQDMSYHLTRPPRLPLPIEEEVHTPGSPIIAPTDLDVDAPALDVESLENDTNLQRRSSALSNTTIDEEDAEELRVDKTGATVPTTFEWHQKGDKVYVTGTIFQWNKKHRLHPVEGQPDLLRSTVHVRPGTHHIRFIVDGIMQCSPDLPTTVDFGNNLVNYIEVSADDLPHDADDVAASGALVGGPDSQQPGAPTKVDATADEEEQAKKPAPKTKPVLPQDQYTSQIPQYLVDLDKGEETSAYQHAAAAIEKLPSPPSLPGFLGKPILNAATPMKDDNSVLTMPNHTVLNHLATSSIKNNVLAVSATTRYMRKYVTTIMYKPTGDD